MARSNKAHKRSSKKKKQSYLPMIFVCTLFLVSVFVVGAAQYVKADVEEPNIVIDNIDPNFYIKTKVTQFFEDNDAAEMIPIIKCESHFRHYDKDGELLRNREGSSAVGVAQIMSSVHPDPKIIKKYNEKFDMDLTVDSFDITTFAGNIGYALVLYKVRGVRDWECSKKFRF